MRAEGLVAVAFICLFFPGVRRDSRSPCGERAERLLRIAPPPSVRRRSPWVRAIYRMRVFDAEIIELCVRWYISYRLSYRVLVQMMAERGVQLAFTNAAVTDS
jgi:hypothetical protein